MLGRVADAADALRVRVLAGPANDLIERGAYEGALTELGRIRSDLNGALERLPQLGPTLDDMEWSAQVGVVEDRIAGGRLTDALAQVDRLNELRLVEGDAVDLAALKVAGIIKQRTLYAKVVASGEISKAVTVRGIGVSKGARAAIEAAGGQVED